MKMIITGNIFVFSINSGYNALLKRNLYILPVAGAGWKSDIYQNHYCARETYSYKNFKAYMNIGFYAKIYLKGDIGLIAGIGYPEIGKLAVVYKIWD